MLIEIIEKQALMRIFRQKLISINNLYLTIKKIIIIHKSRRRYIPSENGLYYIIIEQEREKSTESRAI